MTRAFLRGYVAGVLGKEFGDNPYESYKEQDEWSDGWILGIEDRIEEE